ncbi:hypothetical protein EGW08_004181 [Elysia chlorotica]|uniref:Major facilitator superfamily (MFS) profile domain-containing protein n=1 Tax=Elysia chlorotica TaxID=188477 RepID=A0A3S1BNX1_ELYCH|nr:hypothetical protein EGW08_004181 [Elysia chlorotica]
MCSYGCAHIYTYFAAITVRGLFGTLSIVPKLIVYIRCVTPKDKGLAIGFSAFMTSLLGWLLGPIIFGRVIDGICTVWDVTQTGNRGRCLLYDNDVFRLKLHGFSSAGLLGCTSFLLIGYVYARCTGCLDPPSIEVTVDGTQMKTRRGQKLRKGKENV